MLCGPILLLYMPRQVLFRFLVTFEPSNLIVQTVLILISSSVQPVDCFLWLQALCRWKLRTMPCTQAFCAVHYACLIFFCQVFAFECIELGNGLMTFCWIWMWLYMLQPGMNKKWIISAVKWMACFLVMKWVKDAMLTSIQINVKQ